MQNRLTVNSDQNQISQSRIAVIGDIMIDVDIHCSCSRICPEGPWPVFLSERIESRMGGAGNVAEMLLALGARTMLLGLVGSESPLPPVSPGISPGWCLVAGQSTTKSRYWVDGRLTGPRLDHDLRANPSTDDLHFFIGRLQEFQPSAIIVADHGKGVITDKLMNAVAELDIATFVDPIRATPFSNDCRYAAMAGGPHELSASCRDHANCVIEKHGPNGLFWSLKSDPATAHRVPSACRKAVDPLGAGDQFIAALTVQRCAGVDWPDAIVWANVAAGLQCERPGCMPLTAEEIETRIALELLVPKNADEARTSNRHDRNQLVSC